MGGPEEPSTETLAPSAVPVVTDAAPTLIGRTLGKLTIVERLGQGGSGEVFRAEQLQLGRSAVIKVLRREVAFVANRVERFLREAKLASRLDHPYAAHIYGFGAEPDGVLWIAMEHVKGGTLDELVARRGAMPTSVFAPLFARLCEVVHTAHELGIVHRDIKGSNVMVIERAGQLLPKLLDFGIAKAEEPGTSPGVAGEAELTGHGVTLGSPHYMSPEQWQRPSEVDGRADIYALGVLGYRCVAGWLPFSTLDRPRLAEAHLHTVPPPLPDFVPRPLAAAILRALEKAPEARWQTALELGDAVRRAAGTVALETVPIFDPGTRDAWLRAGPQPIADALAHLTSATTTADADASLRELVAITCRWLAVLGLSGLPAGVGTGASPAVREHARAVVGRDDGAPWLRLARAAVAACEAPLPGLAAALAGSDELLVLADRLDDRDRVRTAATLAADVATVAEALRPLEPLLAYQLVLGAGASAESWQGTRRRDRERVLVWGEPLAEGVVALLDAGGHVVARLSPLAQVIAPLPSAEPELFLLWRSGRGPARLVAAPWGFERDDEAAGLRLAALSTEDSDTAADPGDDRSPYPGLAAYGVDDADHFVGREREVEALANRLVRAPLLAVLGPSGVGKSSFVHAGLVARLGEHHRIVTMRPGRHPIRALAALIGGDDDLVSRLRALGDSAERGVVLVVDQLEELVTLCGDADERRRFAETLAAAADGPSAPVRVVATLRDDFATLIEGEAALRGKFEVFVLGTPPIEALRRIVTEPARRLAVTVDPRVVDDMVAEVAGRPASLPLLSFTGSLLWETRDKVGHTITHDSYLALGGVAGALATYADEVYASLACGDQDIVRDVFSRLVAADGTRVPSPRDELAQLAGAPGVLAHLIEARLLVVRDDEGRDVVEIVHECLAERWPRLARWRSEDAADRALLGDLRAAARRWQDAGQRGDLLWRGQALAELRRLAGHSTALTVVERAFATAAFAAEQRARRVRRGSVVAAMAVLASVAGVMAYLSVAANDSRAAAERSAARARDAAQLAEDRLTQSLVAQGRRELNDDRALPALAYFAEAMRRGADSVGLRTMVAIASRAWPHVLATRPAGTTVAIVGSPAGWVATSDPKAVIHWWSDTGASLGELATEIGGFSGLRRLPDDKLLVVGGEQLVVIGPKRTVVRRLKLHTAGWAASEGPGPGEITVVESDAVRVYDRSGKPIRTVQLVTRPSEAEQLFDRGGRHLLFGDAGHVFVVDLATMQIRTVAHDTWGPPSGAEDGSIFGYLDHERALHLIDGAGSPIRTIQPTLRPTGFEFSADGQRIGLTGEHDLAVYDRTGKALATYAVAASQTVFVLRGDDAWTGGNDGVVHHYHDGALVASLPLHATEIISAALAKNALAVNGSDSSLVIARADVEQLHRDAAVCPRPALGANGIATAYDCGGTVRLYVGRRRVGDTPTVDTQIFVAVDAKTERGAVATELGVTVFDGHAKPIATTKAHGGAIAFEDGDHLLVLEPKHALRRWAFATDSWQDVMPVGDLFALAFVGGAAVMGGNGPTLVVAKAGREIARVDVGEQTTFLVGSPDDRWLAAHLMSGATAIIDASAWQLVRKLAPSDSFGSAPTFDATGELILRTSHNAISIWDRATGDELVFELDLLRDLENARFLPDGRIEVNAQLPGVLDIPPETRPIPQILHDIACKVRLKVVGSQLEPSTAPPVSCEPGASGRTLPE